MGCDIHLFTEQKRTINSQERWVNVDNWKLNPYFKTDPSEREWSINEAYRGRNYTLFSILADVRNDSSNIPIAQPKGLPPDVSEVVKKESNLWDSDGHSHSYLTMQELYDYYEKNKRVNHSGLVDVKGSEAIDCGEMPEWWCGRSNRGDLVYREWTEENVVINNFIETLETHFKSEYYEKERDSEKFRIVFWFDN